ncbi:rubrerythrin-like domain-containing protein [Haloarchaeobius amylolyticus]|uniref:Rubrerythrin-like domain-containing protein n=1 Tax=Haloarchaeobius amylolyticus TaxID=1198296 RepID=A0ABD6BCA6_9EURY
MYDLTGSPDATSTYECLVCGEIITADTRAEKCTRCGRANTLQNRALSLE